MPQTKGAIKRVRLEEKRRVANKGKKIEMRKQLKSFDAKAADAPASMSKLQSTLDKMARKGLIKKNFAANKKAKLMKAIAKKAA